VAPGPEKARKLSSAKVQSLLRKAGRSRYLQSRADEISSALKSEQLVARAGIETAYTATTKGLVAVIAELNTRSRHSRGRWRSVLAGTRTLKFT
jgi:hypothetical protein